MVIVFVSFKYTKLDILNWVHEIVEALDED